MDAEAKGRTIALHKHCSGELIMADAKKKTLLNSFSLALTAYRYTFSEGNSINSVPPF